MSTPHISAEKGDFAKTVLMPGDPLRAKFIADTFLKDVRQVTGVRGMLGFTGTYEGRPISVMGSGMGMPSIGIYSYELFKFYDVENIVRIGSAGSYTDKAKLVDTVLAAGAVSESNYARVQSGFEGDITLPSQSLNDKLRASAAKQGISLIEGNIHSSDVFYRQPSDAKPTYWEKLRDERGCLCVEMTHHKIAVGHIGFFPCCQCHADELLLFLQSQIGHICHSFLGFQGAKTARQALLQANRAEMRF